MSKKNDNRNYNFTQDSSTNRIEYSLIADWISNGDRVIDLGCGDGSLLHLLKQKGATVRGIEISESGVKSALNKGVKASVGRIDEKLPFKDNTFDYAICNVSIQMVMYPEVLLKEMKRISKKQIISFPNYGFILNRLDMLFKGRMPKVMIPGYDWYSTGHIHQLSIKDFLGLSARLGLYPLDQKHLYPSKIRLVANLFMSRFPNFFSNEAVFLMGKK